MMKIIRKRTVCTNLDTYAFISEIRFSVDLLNHSIHLHEVVIYIGVLWYHGS